MIYRTIGKTEMSASIIGLGLEHIDINLMKKKIFITLSLILITSYNISAQSVYTYDLKKDLIIGTFSLGLSIPTFFIHRSANMAERDLILQKSSVNAFDRNLMYEFNRPIDITSDVLLYGLMAMPLLSLAGNYRDNQAWLTYGIMYAEASLLVFGTTEMMKKTIPRYRPYYYFGEIPSGESSEYYKSMPSRHTAFAFMSASFFTSTFFAENPDSPWRIPLSIFSYTLATGVGATRIFSGNHFLSDVLIGAGIGTLIGYIIPWLHIRQKDNTLTMAITPFGFSVIWRF